MHRLNTPEFADPLLFTPAQESAGSVGVRRPCDAVADVDSENSTKRSTALSPLTAMSAVIPPAMVDEVTTD